MKRMESPFSALDSAFTLLTVRRRGLGNADV